MRSACPIDCCRLSFLGSADLRVRVSLNPEDNSMRTIKFTFWRDDEFYIGFLNEYPDYQTQAYSREELSENLKDLLTDLESGQVPYIRKVDELLVV
jgi:hypothetical protein